MVNEKILEFYEEFRDEVLGYAKENGPISTNTAFKTLFLSYLTETGETLEIGRASCRERVCQYV